MRFDLADLQAFVAVAELMNFRAAADSIHLSQPALSRRVAKLEVALGVRLFERTTRRVSLTAVGRDFAHKARSLLDQLEHSLLSIGEGALTQLGEVTIACFPSAVYYFLPNVLRDFHAQFPRIRVRIIDVDANAVLTAVARGEADFGLNFIGTQEPDIEFQPILREPFVAACRRDHPLARKRSVTWAELGAYDFMTVDKTSGNRLLLDLALANTSIRPRWAFEAKHVLTLVGLVQAGLGVAVVPRLAMPPADDPSLVSIALKEPAVTRTVGLIRRRGRSLPAAAQSLYAMLQRAWPRRGARSTTIRASRRLQPN